MPRKVIFLLGIFCFTVTISTAQKNYALNGSFEELTDCPRGEGDIKLAKGYTGYHTSTDLFARCGDPSVSVPKNGVGFQESCDGDNMAGIMATTKGYSYYDYIIGTLDHKNMIPGRTYCVTMKVSLADESPFALDQLAISFCDTTKDWRYVTPTGRIYTFNPLVQGDYETTALGLDQDLTDTEHWIILRGEILYKEGMKYFWIGANHKVLKHRIPVNSDQRVFNPDRTVYYYVDDIRITDQLPSADTLKLTVIPECSKVSWTYEVKGNPVKVQWYRDGKPIPGESGRILTTMAEGQSNQITAHAIYEERCDTVRYEVESKDIISAPSRIAFFSPNPTPDDVETELYFSGKPDEVKTTIYTMAGRVVRQYKYQTEQGYGRLKVPMEDLAPAMYFIEIQSDGCTYSGKVIRSD